MDSSDEAIGRWVLEKRVSKGISQAFLAAQLMRDQTFVSKIESGVRRLSAVELFELSSKLNLKPEELADLYRGWCEVRESPTQNDR
jgi:transcriptional regulator with XRE-family HTH domain